MENSFLKLLKEHKDGRFIVEFLESWDAPSRKLLIKVILACAENTIAEKLLPLTTEQIKERIGKPIYVQALDGAGQMMSGYWHILDIVNEDGTLVFKDTMWIAEMNQSRIYDDEPLNLRK